ncbi:MAG: C40 family peptidase [Rhodobacteraceae bacterium]|nr:C40 family peptidase [Paracoccaceae bacterium]
MISALNAAREMLGTPYALGARKVGLGCDCIGLIEHVYQRVRGKTLPMRPPIIADWHRGLTQEVLITAADKHLARVDKPILGDVLIFRIKERLAAQHCAVVSKIEAGKITQIIHAHDRKHAARVVEVPFSGMWAGRLIGIWRV